MTVIPAEKMINFDWFDHLSTPKNEYRNLTAKEIDALEKNRNYADNWKYFFVKENFNPHLIKNSEFNGPVYISGFEKKRIEINGLRLQTGIYNSTISHAIIGNNVVLKNVHYLYNYIIEDDSILLNIDEITCSENATFGNGYRKGTKERTVLKLANENGGRQILPFENILPADAFLWSCFREDALLLKSLTDLTDKMDSYRERTIGFIGKNGIIKNSRKLEDFKSGPFVEIDGANHLKNITVQSSKEEPTYIGDSSELINGIVGFSNKILHGPTCINFVTGRNVKIELGARIVHTLVGSNSTIACCEVLNNLIFPFHEQHHNNSFLIASTISGQSNIAAGATIGSNHNSRAADGEIFAGRGFWPGLNSSYKHNSVFAAFSLIAKGSYETELNVRLPFSLISKNTFSGKLQILPAFWFRYNMYALARNTWKFRDRDERIIKEQNIETDFLAPDTAQEMLSGINIIEQAIKEKTGSVPFVDEKDFTEKSELSEVYLTDMAPKEKVLIIKPVQAIWLYKLMISYFAAKEILKYIQNSGNTGLLSLFKNEPESTKWLNFGGQLIAEKEYGELIKDIKKNELDSWKSIHDRYNELWQKYEGQKRDFAIQCWLKKEGKSAKDISKKEVCDLLIFSVKIDKLLLNWTKESRLKDYSSPFRQTTYRNKEEMNAVLGKYKENPFILKMEKEHYKFTKAIETIVSQLAT